MKYKSILMFVVVSTIFAALAQAQYRPDLMPPLKADPSASAASINVKSNTIAPPSTETCTYNFTVPGKLNSYLSFCVTVNGNIVSLQSPSGFDQIAQGGAAEGYGICDASTGVSYYDWAYFDSGTWGAPVLVSSTASAVKIARTTTDGLWTLTQTIAKQAGVQPFAKITMALKNNTGIAKTAYLVRYADIDPAASPFTDTNFAESFDSSQYGAWGYAALNNSLGHAPLGVMLEEIGQPNVPYGFEGIAQKTSGAPNACNPGGNYAGYQASVDGSVELFWVLSLGAGKTGTVNAKYEPF
ncbi:MAG TPA: hypothetical protein VMG82_27725 [Candidatus Sulfotelmatobacter sp.]|nr:hypothetical protein [Candidatus Sulfotelmatobacter sp.]